MTQMPRQPNPTRRYALPVIPGPTDRHRTARICRAVTARPRSGRTVARAFASAIATLSVTALTPSVSFPVDAATNPYASPAPFERYLSSTGEEEVRLARSAAPPAIANQARILVLGRRGFQTAIAGTNGFTCLVQRSWASDFDDPEFWNPKIRAPICFNPAAARSVLPTDIQRTQWVMAGMSRSHMRTLTVKAVAQGLIRAPQVGAMCFMMSKGGYLSDKAGGHWHPHLMYFLPRTADALWGANREGSPIMASTDSVVPVTVFFAAVPRWSDGTPG